MNLGDIETLRGLEVALARFAHAAEDACTAADTVAMRAAERLRARFQHWHHEVEQRQATVDDLRAELDECESSGDRNCGDLETALSRAEMKRDEAVEELEKARAWLSRVEDRIERYRGQARRLRRLVYERGAKAQAFLQLKQAEVRAYLAVAPSGGTSTAAGAVAGGHTAERTAVDGLDHAREAAHLLGSIAELRPDNWRGLNPVRRLEILRRVESALAGLQGREATPVEAKALRPGEYGVFDGRTITLNEAYLGNVAESLATLAEESYHAYEWHACENSGVDPREEIWRYNMVDNYLNCDDYGQELYDGQPCETPAKEYAWTLLNALWAEQEGFYESGQC
jgi:hypothetical protein